MKVDAKWLLLILLFFGSLLFAQHWAGSQWRSNQGPDLLATDQQGNLYIGLHSKILRYSPGGNFLDQRDLMQLGIETHIGGIAIFPNGDLLMVPQNYQPSFLQRLLIQYRITAPVRSSVQGSSGRLSRCVWETMVCTPLPELTQQFGDVFWVDIDSEENIFLADTSQHQIFWLDKDGKEIDRIGGLSSLQFPNQIKRQGNKLWIANCNDNSLSNVSVQQNKFSQAIERFPLIDARLPANDRWPIGVVVAEDDFLVLAKGSNLMHGSIVRMDGAGKIEDVFTGAMGSQKSVEDYIALAWVNNEVFAADFASLSIKRFSKYGELKGEFNAPEFIAATGLYRQQMVQYQQWERYFSWLFWSLLIVGFALAFYLERRHKALLVSDDVIAEANPHFAPQTNDKRIQWLVYKFFWRNINKWLIWFWVPLLLLILPALFSAEEESVWRSACLLLTHGLLLLELINGKRLTRRQLGALDPWVFIKDGKRVQFARETDISSYRWLGSMVLMIGGEDILVTRRGKMPLFEGVLAQGYIERLIGIARPMSGLERLQWLLDNKLPSLVWQLLLVLLYVLALLVGLLPTGPL